MHRSPLSPPSHRPGPRPALAVSEADAASFLVLRPRLFGIAYRVLGSAVDADDIVQDTWVRWHGADRREVRDPAAFLTTVARRLALNVRTSAYTRRETGPWLSEPGGTLLDPMLDAERGEALADAIRLLAERLTPTERAAYVLREGFDYPYRRIAEVICVSEANARQIVTRARARLHAAHRRGHVGADVAARLLEAVILAGRTGDLGPLERELTDDIAAPTPIRAPTPVASMMSAAEAEAA